MRKLVHFIGMRRTGNHAVINWLQKNAFSELEEGTSIHFNDIYAPNAIPSRLLRPQDVHIVSSSENLLLILSYEDLQLETIPTLPTILNESAILNEGVKIKYLLMRDPYNTFASRLQRIRTAEREKFNIAMQQISWSETVNLWKSYAREYLGKTNILGDIITVSYNKWVSDKDYRDGLLCHQFGREDNLDIGMNEVSNYGSGSSFDRLSYSGRGTEMAVQSRWRDLLQDEFYRDLFRDEELQFLSQEIFGYISGTEALYNQYRGRERI